MRRTKLLNVLDMEDKLIKWIFGVAGSSYVMIVSLIIVFVLATKDGALQDPFYVKALVLLCAYFFSLWLLNHAKSKVTGTRLKLWLSSLIIHLAIMSYVLYVFGDPAAFVIMIPEVGVLLLMLVGIYSIWSKVRAANL